MPYSTFLLVILFSVIITRKFNEIKKEKHFLEEAIVIDPLTGLYNRIYLNSLINQGFIIKENSRLFILFLDLDKFKIINDNYGHDIGDMVLIEAAHRIKACFKETDIICRYGGDEFIVFTQIENNYGNIEKIVGRVTQFIDEPFIIENVKYFVSISIGISEYHDGDNLEEVIKESDKDMYNNKKSAIKYQKKA
jgi:diguanylate cyclase (GGDEF)-like protein